MLFKIVCLTLLVGILIAVILILTILVRNLIRDFKKEVLAQVKEGMIPVLERLDEIEHQGLAPILEKLDPLLYEGLYPLGDRIVAIQNDVRSLLWESPVGHGSSNMTGQSPAAESGHSIHYFTNGGWELQEDFSKFGYEANQPLMAGNYEGQVVKTTSSVSSGKTP
jgi:hypothetical protein